MKKILVIIIGCLIVLSLVACGSVDKSVHVNVENSGDLSNVKFGRSALLLELCIGGMVVLTIIGPQLRPRIMLRTDFLIDIIPRQIHLRRLSDE